MKSFALGFRSRVALLFVLLRFCAGSGQMAGHASTKDKYLHGKEPDAVVGTWETSDAESHIQIYRKGDLYYGKIVWLKEPKDENGEEVRGAKGERILGLELMSGFEYDEKDERYENGRIYDPESGKTYYASMYLKNGQVLKLKGSLDKYGMLGRTETWKRVKD